MKLLFLDVDGVLNSQQFYSHKDYRELMENPIDRACVTRVRQIVEQTGALIVLTSTWRGGWEKEPALCTEEGHILNAILGGEGLNIYDKTGIARKGRRPAEIQTWIKEHTSLWGVHALSQYLILDDNDFGWKAWHMDRHVVQTDFRNGGLLDEHVVKAIDILREPMGTFERIKLKL